MSLFEKKNSILILTALAADRLIGDPEGLPHPVVLMGKEISALEKYLLKTDDPLEIQRVKGAVLAVAVPLTAAAGTKLLSGAARMIHPTAGWICDVVLCTYALASKSLADAAGLVQDALEENDLEKARRMVGRIVGRDTEALSFSQVAKAAVESVAESTSDGVIAPLFYMAAAGPVGAMAYKAINTMDSMIGYKNEKYRYFGTAGARLDDFANLIPSRMAAGVLIAAAKLCGEDARGGLRIFLRDRYNHKSPNSAQTESVMAGALGLRLGGNAFYFGKEVEKPSIGDPRHEAGAEGIAKSVKLMYAASALGAGILAGLCLLTE